MKTRTLQLIATLLLLAVAAVLALNGLLYGPSAVIEWNTESEVGTLGFHVYRATDRDGPYERVSESIIVGEGDPFSGSDYTFRDENAEAGRTYFYQLEELEESGAFNRLPDTVEVRVQNEPNLLTTVPLLFALILVWLLPKPPARRVSGTA